MTIPGTPHGPSDPCLDSTAPTPSQQPTLDSRADNPCAKEHPWSSDEVGLPIFGHTSVDDAVDEYRAQQGEFLARLLRLGAIGYAVDEQRVYGEGNFKAFVKRVGKRISYSTAQDYKRVYGRLNDLAISERSEILGMLADGTTCYSVVLAASSISDKVEFVRVVREADSSRHAADMASKINRREKSAAIAERDDAEVDAALAAAANLGATADASEVSDEEPGAATTPSIRLPQPRAALIEHGPEDLLDVTGVNLYRGNCRELLRLLPSSSVDGIVTDGPYGVDDKGGRGKASQGRIAGDMTPEEAASLLQGALEALDKAFRPHIHAACCASPKSHIVALMIRAVRNAGLEPSEIPIVWLKGRSFWRQKYEAYERHHETIIHAMRGRPTYWPHSGGSVLDYPAIPEGRRYHHHQKPLGLVLRLVRDFVPPNGLVVDPFAGSGTTLVAAELLGRRAVGIELDEDHHRNAVGRLDRVRRAPESLRQKWLEEALRSPDEVRLEELQNEAIRETLHLLREADDPDESSIARRMRAARLTEAERLAIGFRQIFDPDELDEN